MALTFDLPPPSSSSTSSNDDDYPLYSASSTDAIPSDLLPICASRNSDSVNLDVPRYDILGPSPYTQHFLYPNLSNPLPPSPGIHKKPSHIAWHPSTVESAGVTPGAQPQNKARHNRRSGTLPLSFDKHLYRPGHPSFVKFPEGLPLNRPQLHGLRSPHPRCISNTMGTEALISLAWTGEISSPIAALGYAPSRVGDTYMWPKLRISDAEVVPKRRALWPRKCGEQEIKRGHENIEQSRKSPSRNSPRLKFQSERWTLANAISDDQVSDETLVELLEELRLRRLRSNERSAFRFLPELVTPAEETPDHIDIEPPRGAGVASRASDAVPENMTKAWSSARRAVLVCRELVRTERHYLNSLHALLKGETQSPPPPLMLSRLPALIDASTLLVDLMETNPSVLGVCTAFLQVYERLEEAFVQWCEVVGQFFTADSTGNPDTLVKRSNSAPTGPNLTIGEKTLLTKSVVGSWGRKIQPRSINLDEIASMVTGHSKAKAQSKPPARDLAILPTQRITRYVLLFKDLLIRSPPLDIKLTVEHATEAAITLAAKADRAQDHAAFRMVSEK